MKKSIYMTQELINQYGRINGDNDIVHYDHDYALGRGFRGTLAHGMQVLGYAADLAAAAYGREFFSDGELYVKWIAPVCPDDNLTVELAGDGAVTAQVQTGDVMVGYARVGNKTHAGDMFKRT